MVFSDVLQEVSSRVEGSIGYVVMGMDGIPIERLIADRRHNFDMIATERPFTNGQCSLVKGLGVGVAALPGIQHSQIVQQPCNIGMIATERLFADGQ